MRMQVQLGGVPVRGCVTDTQETGREHSAPQPRAEGRRTAAGGMGHAVSMEEVLPPPPTDRDIGTRTLKDTHPTVNSGHLWGGR